MSTVIGVPHAAGSRSEEPCAPGVLFADDTPTLPVPGEAPEHAAASVATRSLDSGTELCSRYVLEDVVGSGGNSLVFRARDLHWASSADATRNPIAIKVIRPELRGDRLALECLQREFRRMQRLSHPNIVRVFDLCHDGDLWFFTMQLIVGPTAKTWSSTSHEPTAALRIIDGCCAALEHAHSLGILHGDLKPTNVLIAEHGKANLIDFGSLPESGGPSPAAGLRDRTATPAFASPQILMGREAEQRDDVFGIACLSYALLSGGGHPFGGRPAFEDGRIKSAPTYAHSIAPEIFKVIERGLSGERERRHASVREFRMELAAAESDSRKAPSIVTPGESIRLGAPMAADGPLAGNPVAALMPWASPLKVGRGFDWRTTLGVALVALGIAAGGTAFYFRHGTTGTSGNATAMAAPFPIPAAELEPALPLSAAVARPLLERNGVVSFAATKIEATAAQSVIAIALRRSGRTETRGEFRWRVTTHRAANAPDYIAARTGLARFNEGQTVRTLFIPLVNEPNSPARGPRIFSVTLEPVVGGSALGSPSSITVAIDPPASAGDLTANYLRASR